MSQHIPDLFVAASNISGRGVFCGRDIPEGSLIEICPVIRIPAKDMNHMKATTLYDYYFEWGESDLEGAIALGSGSIYNHSTTPNAKYLADYENDELQIIAIKNIEAGTEITFNYHGTPNQKGKVWFEEEDL